MTSNDYERTINELIFCIDLMVSILSASKFNLLRDLESLKANQPKPHDAILKKCEHVSDGTNLRFYHGVAQSKCINCGHFYSLVFNEGWKNNE